MIFLSVVSLAGEPPAAWQGPIEKFPEPKTAKFNAPENYRKDVALTNKRRVSRDFRRCQMGGQCEQVLQFQRLGKKVTLCLLATETDQYVLLESRFHAFSSHLQMQ
jgi:hypothetical protein